MEEAVSLKQHPAASWGASTNNMTDRVRVLRAVIPAGLAAHQLLSVDEIEEDMEDAEAPLAMNHGLPE